MLKALGRGSVAYVVKVGLEVAWVILWVAAAAIAAFATGYVGVLAAIATGALAPDVLHIGETTTRIGPISIVTEEGDRLIWPVVATGVLAGSVASAGGLAVIWRLRRLFDSFIGAEPFSIENARHLRAIWIIMAAMEVSRYLISGSVWLLVTALGQPQSLDLTVRAPVNFMTWGAILVLIVLAEVFREGARLREQEKLTI